MKKNNGIYPNYLKEMAMTDDEKMAFRFKNFIKFQNMKRRANNQLPLASFEKLDFEVAYYAGCQAAVEIFFKQK